MAFDGVRHEVCAPPSDYLPTGANKTGPYYSALNMLLRMERYLRDKEDQLGRVIDSMNSTISRLGLDKSFYESSLQVTRLFLEEVLMDPDRVSTLVLITPAKKPEASGALRYSLAALGQQWLLDWVTYWQDATFLKEFKRVLLKGA